MQADTESCLHLQTFPFSFFLITFLINYFVFSSELKFSHILIPMHVLLVVFKYMSYMRKFLIIFNNYFPLIILNTKINYLFFSNFEIFVLNKFILSNFLPTETTHVA